MRIYADIGELGWSLYLAGYLRWLNQNGDNDYCLFTEPARKCLFNTITPVIHDLPFDFKEKFGTYSQDGFGLYGVPHHILADYFRNQFNHSPRPELAPEFRFSCNRFFAGKMIFKRYPSKGSDIADPIIIFPRYRTHSHHAKRNLPEIFYLRLAAKLCDSFPLNPIVAVGTKSGAYDLCVPNNNFINLVGKTHTLQSLLDLCFSAVAAVGGTSAPPKISLLQGVPTYVIGHEQNRFAHDDNWMNTLCGFWEIDANDYNSFDSRECIDDIVDFVSGVIDSNVAQPKPSSHDLSGDWESAR